MVISRLPSSTRARVLWLADRHCHSCVIGAELFFDSRVVNMQSHPNWLRKSHCSGWFLFSNCSSYLTGTKKILWFLAFFSWKTLKLKWKKRAISKAKKMRLWKGLTFFPDKNTLTFFFLPVFTVLHLNKPLVPRIAVILLSCQYLFREGESWACSILFETQGKQNEIAALQKAATVIHRGRGESAVGIKERNNTDKSEVSKWF